MSAGRVRKAYQFIEAHRRDYPVQTLCQVLEVAPSGYYAWLHKLYLAVVMDLYSRRIVGWATRATIHRELVLDAVLMAVCRRRFCKSHHLEPSMSRRGNCWDNAVAESFFGSLKKEQIKKHMYKDRESGKKDIADYIKAFYN